MSYQDFMNKVRHWDNLLAKWILRHFYFMFFQIVLVAIFLCWFINLFNVIDTASQANRSNLIERMLSAQSVNTTIVVFLLLLNSFWMLYIFNGVQRMMSSLRDMSYHLSRLRQKDK